MEKIMITCHLGFDANVRQHGNDECANFTVGCTRRYKQGDETKEETTWYQCTLWRPNRVKDYLKKGQLVLVEGKPSCRNYENRAGKLVAQIDITVQHVELLGKNPNAEPKENNATPNDNPLMDEGRVY